MTNETRHIVPQEIRSQTKVIKGIYLFDLAFIISYYLFFSAFIANVHGSLTVLYHITNIIIPLILTRKSPFNSGKRIFQTIYFIIIADRSTYHEA
ncbi:MAG: DUF5592 family protein [Anaerovoracaceae bacterium]